MNEIQELVGSMLTVSDGLLIVKKFEEDNRVNPKVKKTSLEIEQSRALERDFRAVFYRLPVVILTLSIMPSLNFIKDLQDWFSANIGERVIFDLKIEPEIIGGAKIICKNHFVDYSLATIINEGKAPENNLQGEGLELDASSVI